MFGLGFFLVCMDSVQYSLRSCVFFLILWVSRSACDLQIELLVELQTYLIFWKLFHYLALCLNADGAPGPVVFTLCVYSGAGCWGPCPAGCCVGLPVSQGVAAPHNSLMFTTDSNFARAVCNAELLTGLCTLLLCTMLFSFIHFVGGCQLEFYSEE